MPKDRKSYSRPWLKLKTVSAKKRPRSKLIFFERHHWKFIFSTNEVSDNLVKHYVIFSYVLLVLYLVIVFAQVHKRRVYFLFIVLLSRTGCFTFLFDQNFSESVSLFSACIIHHYFTNINRWSIPLHRLSFAALKQMLLGVRFRSVQLWKNSAKRWRGCLENQE